MAVTATQVKELRDKSPEELSTLLKELKAKLSQLRFDVSARQVKNYKEVKRVKKNIAQILTLQKQSK